MKGQFNQSQFSDSLKNFNINQVGLQQAQKNYFIKYAQSGYSQLNNIEKPMKKQTLKIQHIQNITYNQIKSNQNQVLKQLKQQYQILKNIPIHNHNQNNLIKHNQYTNKRKHQQQSQYSSSYNQKSSHTSSKKTNHKKYSRDVQILALQKKQLEIVINNSMKKIQQLLTNQMEFKKIIHQLKLQIQGKGGINNQYQITIKNYKQNLKQQYQKIINLKQQIQNKNLSIKQLTQRNLFLQTQKTKKDQIQRNYFQQQRQMDTIIRNQKDKSMNTEMQLKKIQMEYQILQKDKNSQINRLNKQLQIKDLLPETYNDTIKKLKEQLQNKQYKNQLLIDQIQQIKLVNSNKPVSSEPDTNKKILQQLVKQMKAKNQSSSKDNNEVLTKALIQKFSTQRQSILKNQLSTLKIQVDNIRRNSSVSEYPMFNNQDQQLKSRLRQLQRIVEQQKKQKKQLYQDIQKLRQQRDQVYKQLQFHKRKPRQYKQIEERLINKIEEINQYKAQLDHSKSNNSRIQQKVNKIRANYDLQQSLVEREFYTSQNQNVQSYQDQIRILKTKIDQLSFALQIATQQKAQTQNLIKQQKQNQVLGVIADLNRYKLLLRDKQSQIIMITQSFKKQIQQKNYHITQLTKRLNDLQQNHKSLLQSLKINHQQLLKTEADKHHAQLQSMNLKIIELTKTVQNFSSKAQYYSDVERQTIQLRRLTKNTKKVTQAVDHLWQIKEAQYGNINQIFNIIKNVSP